MPAGLIEEENSVSARSDFGCDLIEVKLHSFGVAGRQHEGGAGSAFGADRTEQIGRLGPLIVGGTGGASLSWPSARSACSFGPPASHLYMRARMSKGHQFLRL
jgi:hypothetical protein